MIFKSYWFTTLVVVLQIIFGFLLCLWFGGKKTPIMRKLIGYLIGIIIGILGMEIYHFLKSG